MDSLQPEETEIIQKGRDYRALKEMSGYKRLIKHLISRCNEKEERLRTGEELEDRASLRLLDRWRSFEQFYEELVTEIETSISTADEKERELREIGIQPPELMAGPNLT
jgi:hypothetical protein